MKINGILIASILLMALLSGCISQQTQNTAANSDNQGVAIGEPNPSSPPANNSNAMPLPTVPTVKANDQSIQNDTVTVEFVYVEQDGWLVIHADKDGAPGAPIGFVAVKKGLTDAVQVPIDVLSATPTLYAMLHVDTGKIGEYDYPAADAAVKVNGEIVMHPFAVSNLPAPAPEPEPIVAPAPTESSKEFSIVADEAHYDPSTISVNKGDHVKITFNFNDEDIYNGGLDIKTNPDGIFLVNYRKDKGYTSTTIEFDAIQSFTYTGFWPASGVRKATGTVEVK